MAVTKTCGKCGWVYPITHPDKRCRFCNEIFKQRFCSDCGRYTDIHPSGSICRPCISKRSARYHDKAEHYAHNARYLQANREKCVTQFNTWIGLINAVPKPYKMLTEDEWISACSYFGSCAICGEDHIESRCFFIPFGLGGRYTSWNVLPVCEKCANMQRVKFNPFLRYDKHFSDTPRDLTKIVEYLQPQLERLGKK